MNSVVELHDSTLAGIEPVGNEIVVRLAPAYFHRSEGRPGIDPGYRLASGHGPRHLRGRH